MPSEDIVNFQADIDSYMTDNVDSVDLGIDLKVSNGHPAPSVDKFDDDFFVSKVLSGNCKNLESILSASMGSHNPLLSVINAIGSSLNLNEEQSIELLFPGVTPEDLSLLFYTNARCVKFFINSHLKRKKPLPATATPMFAKISNPTPLNRSLMVDLLVFFGFYSLMKSQLHQRVDNTTKNKSLITFLLKVITSPFVFSSLDNSSSKEILLEEILNRYKIYDEADVFEVILDEIHSTFAKDVTVSHHAMREVLSKLLDVAIPMVKSFEINTIFNDLNKAKIVMLNKESISNDFSIGQLEKILVLESCYAGKGYIDFEWIQNTSSISKFDNIPDNILSQYGIEQRACDISNLERIIREDMKDNEYLEMALDTISVINYSYRDLEGKDVEWANFPESVLVACSLWDLEDDIKIQSNYTYFRDKITNSSITREMALSMLGNINVREEENYSSGLRAGKIIN